MLDLAALAASAFLAATLLPLSSEALLVALSDRHSAYLLVLVASIFNVAGSAVNYVIGRSFERFSGRSWCFWRQSDLDRSAKLFRRYGAFSLLFAWLPVVGDLLTLAAGVFKLNFVVFIVLTLIGKSTRYALLLGGWSLLGQ